MLLLFLLLGFQSDEIVITEEISVVARTIKIQVLDRKNQPVKGLDPSKFRLTVNGKKSEFYLSEMDYSVDLEDDLVEPENADSNSLVALAPPPSSPRTFAIYWDTSLMAPTGFKAVKESIGVFLNELRPADIVRVYYGDQALRAITSFSRDKEAVVKSLEDKKLTSGFLTDYRQINAELRSFTSQWIQMEEERSDITMAQDKNAALNELKRNIDHAIMMRDDMLDRLAVNQQKSLDAIRRDLQMLKGEKAIVMYTSGGIFSTRLKEEFEGTVARLTGASIAVNAVVFSNKELNLGSSKQQKWRPATRDELDENTNIGSERARTNNQSNADRMGNPNPGGDIMGSDRVAKARIEMDNGLAYFATETGGAFLRMTNSRLAGKVANKLRDVSNHYYNLTYRGEGIENFDKIKLKLKGKKRSWRLIYGSHLKIPSAAEAYTANLKAGFEAGLLHDGLVEEVPLTSGSRVFHTGDGGSRAAMYVGIPTASFPKSGYQLGFAAFDAAGELLDYRENTLLGPVEGDMFKLYDVLVTPTRPKRLRTYLLNLDTGKRNLKEDVLEDPGPKAIFSPPSLAGPGQKALNALHFHTVDDLTKLNPTGLSAKARKMKDPFIVDNRLLTSGLDSTFKAGGALHMFSYVQNANMELPKYRIRGSLKSEAGEEPARLKPLIVRQIDAKTYAFLAELDLSDAKAGDYELTMFIAEPDDEEERPAKTRFSLVD